MKIILIALSLLMIATHSFAGSSCTTDYFGNYVCSFDDGYKTTTNRDYFGNDVTRDNRGNSISCHTDYFGNYVCN